MRREVIGRLVFAVLCVSIVVGLSGGRAFLSRPIGVVYSTLLLLWMTTLAIGRGKGVSSAYDRSQLGIYTLMALIYFAVLFAAPWEYVHYTGPIPRDGPLAWIGLAVLASGIAIRSAAVRELRGLYTARLGIQTGHHLVTTGPYRFIRHPGYLGEIIGVLGIGLALSSVIGLTMAVLLVPLIAMRIETEERMLLAEFEEEYRAYMRRTKRLLPVIY